MNEVSSCRIRLAGNNDIIGDWIILVMNIMKQ